MALPETAHSFHAMEKQSTLTIGLQISAEAPLIPEFLAAIVSQAAEKPVEFLIIDDRSNGEVEKAVAFVAKDFSSVAIRIVKNRAAVGQQACWIRIFEHAETEWIWTIDLSDRLHPDALANVLAAMRSEGAAYICLSGPGFATNRGQTISVRGTEGLLENIGDLRQLAEPSIGLFRRAAFLANLHNAYRYAYCGSAHLALVLGSVKADQISLLANAEIVASFGPNSGEHRLPSAVNAYLGLPVLLELPLSHESRQLLRRHMDKLRSGPMSMPEFKAAAANSIDGNRNRAYAGRVCELAMKRFFGGESDPGSTCPSTWKAGEGESPLEIYDETCGSRAQLTIGIPTYNRPDQIVRIVEQLLPQLSLTGVSLLILDNASEVAVNPLIAPLLKDHPLAQVRVVRNPTNIGGNPNILRLFEHCETEWLWTLGDDDRLAPDVVQSVLRVIEAHRQASYINFASIHETHPKRERTTVATGLTETLRRADYIGSLLFLSACAYRVDQIRPHLRLAHHFVYSCAPQLAIALAALRSGGTAVLSDTVVVEEISDGTPVALQSTSLYPAMGLPTLLEIETDDDCQQLLSSHLAKASEAWLTLRGVTFNLVMSAAASGKIEQSLVHFDAAKRLYLLSKDPLIRPKLASARWMIAHPKLGTSIGNVLYRLIKRRERDTSLFTRDVSARN